MLELQGRDIVPGLVELIRDVVQLGLVKVHTRHLKVSQVDKHIFFVTL